MSAVLAARLCALSLRRAAPQPKAAAVQLSARRCASLSAGASGLRAQPAAARKAAVAVQVVALKNNKTKTRKAAAKRFKVTASGKVVRRHAMKGHLLAKKSPARKRHLSNEAIVSRSDMNNVRDCLPGRRIR